MILSTDRKRSGGSHALRRRCPKCKKLRRFYEPPTDVGGKFGRAGTHRGWAKVVGQWICVSCARDDVRDRLGSCVRGAWIAWALEQPDVADHPSWTVPWDELPERDREVDRRIGEAVLHLTREMKG